MLCRAFKRKNASSQVRNKRLDFSIQQEPLKEFTKAIYLLFQTVDDPTQVNPHVAGKKNENTRDLPGVALVITFFKTLFTVQRKI